MFTTFFKNIIVSKANEDGSGADDYEITNLSTFKVDAGTEYVKFGSVNSFLSFCSAYEDYLAPDVIEIESIWNLFPLHKLSPQVLTRTKSLRINNPSASFIVDASVVYLNYFNKITNFAVNGLSNYKCFVNEPMSLWDSLNYLSINNINCFDFSILNQLPNLETVEINNCRNINFKALSRLKNLYIDNLPPDYDTSYLGPNLRTLLIGNVRNNLNFSTFTHLRQLTILSCADSELQLHQLQVPRTIRLSLNNCKVNLTHLPPTESLSINNCSLLDGNSIQDLTHLSEFSYTANNCINLQHSVTFLLSHKLHTLNAQLMRFYNEIGKIHFQADYSTSSTFTISDDDRVSYFILPETISKLTLNSMYIGSQQRIHFPNDLTWLDLSNNNLTHLSNTNVEALTQLQDVKLTNNGFESDLARNFQIIL